MQVKCIKDNEGYWTEGEMYPAINTQGGFIMLGDDQDMQGDGWSAMPIEYRDDGSIIYVVGGLDGEVLFEEANAQTGGAEWEPGDDDLAIARDAESQGDM